MQWPQTVATSEIFQHDCAQWCHAKNSPPRSGFSHHRQYPAVTTRGVSKILTDAAATHFEVI